MEEAALAQRARRELVPAEEQEGLRGLLAGDVARVPEQLEALERPAAVLRGEVAERRGEAGGGGVDGLRGGGVDLPHLPDALGERLELGDRPFQPSGLAGPPQEEAGIDVERRQQGEPAVGVRVGEEDRELVAHPLGGHPGEAGRGGAGQHQGLGDRRRSRGGGAAGAGGAARAADRP